MSIGAIGKLLDIPAIPKLPSESQTNGIESVSTFADFFKEAVDNVNALTAQSNASKNALAAGLTDRIDEVMIDATKANIALQFTMQIRNKIMDAYSEIMRIQI